MYIPSAADAGVRNPVTGLQFELIFLLCSHNRSHYPDTGRITPKMLQLLSSGNQTPYDEPEEA